MMVEGDGMKMGEEEEGGGEAVGEWEEVLCRYYAEEKSPMELPAWIRLLLRLNSWLLIGKDGYPNRRTQKLTDFRLRAGLKHGIHSHDVVIDSINGVWIRIYEPISSSSSSSSRRRRQQQPPSPFREDGRFPVMFYFHGGGFTMFSADSPFSDMFCRYLSSKFSCVVISADYRKTPNFRFPAPYDDCYAAISWIDEHHTAIPLADLSRCFLVGESAGGNLAYHISVRAAAASELLRHIRIIGIVALFPFFGSETRTAAELRLDRAPMLNYRMCDAAWKDLLPDGATRDHPAANPAEMKADGGQQLPPIMVTVGEYDCLKEHQIRFAMACRRTGQIVELRFYPGGIHCFHVFPQLRLTAQFRLHLRQFLQSCLSSSSH